MGTYKPSPKQSPQLSLIRSGLGREGGIFLQMTTNSAKTRVLVVDDEQLIADTLVLILNQKGFHAIAVYSGEQAVDTALALKPNVLISDIVMGQMNGIEAAILISKYIPDCRILLFSGQPASGELLGMAKLAGHEFDVLAKPVHPEALLELLAAN